MSLFVIKLYVVSATSDRGYQKVGVVKPPAPQPRSYIVKAEGKEYRRNRRNLMSVPEPAPGKLTCPAVTDYDVPYIPSSHVVPPSCQSPSSSQSSPSSQSPVNMQTGPSGPSEKPQRYPLTPTRPVAQRDMLRYMEGRLNQIQTSDT